jgi:nitrate/TMAO reductase-like tetraheme cytochrome c subunit
MRTHNLSEVNTPRRQRWLVLLFAIGFALFAVGSLSFVVASALEEHDPFCISCHTAPEITYYNRAYYALDHPAEAILDLSTLHYHAAQAAGSAPFKCIDCHRGDGSLPHRVTTVALGAYDAVIYLLGQDDPTIEKQRTKTGWLANASCAACHSKTLLKLDGINNHFHTYLPQAREAFLRVGTLSIGAGLQQALAERSSAPPTDLETIAVQLFCSDCHQAHKAQPLTADKFFMDETLRNTACVACHLVARAGPQDARELSGQ